MGKAGEADWVGVLEAMYALELDDESWLQRIADAIRPGLDMGLGIQALRYDVRTPQHATFTPLVSSGGAPWMERGPDNTWERFGPEVGLQLYLGSPSITSARMALAEATGHEDAFDHIFPSPEQPIPDFLVTRSSPTQSLGVLVGAPSPKPLDLAARRLGRLGRVTAHLGAAFRLREGLRREEAILRADGRTEHAEGEARDRSLREALRDAARLIDRARGRLRKRDPWEAVSLWQALVSGRWSLVDRFDSDGRRYLVAMRNPMPRAELRALTAREAEVVTLAARGMSSKLVAYHLGIGASTASTLLARALRKLGVGRESLPLLAKTAVVASESGGDVS